MMTLTMTVMVMIVIHDVGDACDCFMDKNNYDTDEKQQMTTTLLFHSPGDISITKPTASLEPDLSVRLSWNVLPKDQSNSGGFQFKVQMKNLDGSVGWETIRDSMPFNTRTYVVQRELLLPSECFENT